ncbi:hypothetical protein [Fimbriiglobus ruber]|uniref:EF-hand domain-containing protein n=1 Tax=Fimbriiglobus ruber TaxID=1908690 RepID=A0A225DZ55_9BACT|nr:hypothetical protein [Fimbriiglobus ruber]OWK43046.1 hypothetical protein FRUB_02645 [Fimbriiglobus ruber]
MTWFVTLACVAIGQALPQPPKAPEEAATPVKLAEVTAPKGVRHALIICGHPGDAEHVKSFADTVRTLGTGLSKTLGIPAERQHVVFGAEPPKDLPGATGPATKDAVAAAVAEARKSLNPDDGLWVICLGHGHHDGRQAWWNLPGPDVNAAEFGKLFADVTCREQVFVMTMSLGGYFVRPLARRGRVVIAATEAGAEPNETTFPAVFAQYLNSGLKPAEHDVDKDGKLSLFDLYVAVAKEIAQTYADAEQLATEHAQLDDDGDGIGHEVQTPFLPPDQGGPMPGQKKPRNPPQDGLLAAKIILSAGP